MKNRYFLRYLLPSLFAVAVTGCSSIGQDSTVLQAHAESAASPEFVADPSLPPLPVEVVGNVEHLPDTFPLSWMYVDESSFSSMFGGKVIVLDPLEENPGSRIKGMVDKNLLGGFVSPKERNEFYVIETFHERGSRGKKIDLLVIYDKITLTPIKEIVWPETRLGALPRRHAMGISPDERFLYVSNFSPAASFTVVDLDTREIVETVGTPGCVLTFPTGPRSVTSICSNGGLMSSVLDENGRKQSQQFVEPFFDTDDTPIFERPSIIDNIAYFPSFHGDVHMVDLSGDIAQYQGKWNLLSDEEKQQGWRPGGLALIDSDEQGLFYVIMNPEGFEGSQTHGGTQVWVFDPKSQSRVNVIDVPSWAVSVAATRGKEPMLVVTNGEMNLDVFNPRTGELVQTVSGFGNITPLVIHKAY
jgi:methylamine dehydrogenase heavy chain|tara:strand:- start:14243 stop:15487 length:1245 start_codon:yes stop_codon:yes gene_type:complete